MKKFIVPFDTPMIPNAQCCNWIKTLTVPFSDDDRHQCQVTLSRKLSVAQEHLWIASQIFPEQSLSVIRSAEISGLLDETAADRAVEYAVTRTTVLRTSLSSTPSGLLQTFLPKVDMKLKRLDFRSHSNPVEYARKWLQEMACQPRVLEENDNAEFGLIKLYDDRHLFYFRFHHMLIDGRSGGEIVRRVVECYNGLVTGGWLPDAQADDIDATLDDDDTYQKSAHCGNDAEFWQEYTHDISDIMRDAYRSLLVDEVRSNDMLRQSRFERWTVRLRGAEALRIVARSSGLSLARYLVALGALYISLAAGRRRLSFSLPIANTTRGRSTPPGMTSNVLPLVLAFDESKSLTANMTYVSHEINRILPMGKFRGETIVSTIGGMPGEWFGPMLNVLDNQYPSFEKCKTNWSSWSRSISDESCSFVIYADILRDADEIEVTVKCRQPANSPAQHLERMCRLLDLFRQTPDRMLGDIARSYSWLSPLNGSVAVAQPSTKASLARPVDQCIHQMFERFATETPDAVALVSDNGVLTYMELNESANALAHRLITLGVGLDDQIAVCLNRGIDIIVAVLAVLKAGAAYVPLDPSYPQQRLDMMLAMAAPKVCLAHTSTLSLLGEKGPSAIKLDAFASAASEPACKNPVVDGLTPHNLACVLFTSGSTGTPKGVMLEHRGLVNFGLGMARATSMSEASRLLQFASFSFDASLGDILMAYSSGASLYVLSAERRAAVDLFSEFVNRHQVSHAVLPPALVQAWHELHSLPSLRHLILAGEAVSPGLMQALPSTMDVYNAYGPSECSIGTTIWRRPAEYTGAHVPIGRALPNTRVYLLDEAQQPVSPGEIGEIYIGGVGVARGYLNRTDLTVERFTIDPFVEHPDALMYRSGDFARQFPDGTFTFVGRNDDQVKIRGFRVELGEIQTKLAAHGLVREAVVVARGAGADKRLVAYVVPAIPVTGVEFLAVLRSHLAQQLPTFMIPSDIVIVDTFSLTANGKIDHRALPEPVETAAQETLSAELNSSEALVGQLVAELLGRPTIDYEANFFDLGVNSLLLSRLHVRLRRIFSPPPQLVDLFRHTTVRSLARYLEKESSNGAN